MVDIQPCYDFVLGYSCVTLVAGACDPGRTKRDRCNDLNRTNLGKGFRGFEDIYTFRFLLLIREDRSRDEDSQWICIPTLFSWIELEEKRFYLLRDDSSTSCSGYNAGPSPNQ